MPRPLTAAGSAGRSPIREVALVGLALVAGAGMLLGWATYRIWQRGETDERQPADAIVVMGAAQYDGRPSPVFEARLRHAVDLWQQGLAPYLVVTGGGRAGDRTTEAATARAYAVANGVPDAVILSEDAGGTTLESIRNVAEIFSTRHLRSAIFVSDRTHMLRVIRMAKDHGIVATGSPTTTSPTDATVSARFDATIHELGALALYALTGDEAGASAAATSGP
jgi:uncharacterized SAM-binding protein YcdF (DUF218 family)